MKKSFLKKLISVISVFAIVLSAFGVSAFARTRDKYSINILNSSGKNYFASVDYRTAEEGEIVDLQLLIDDDYCLEYIRIRWYDEYGTTREKYLYEDDMVEEIDDNEGIWNFVMPESDVDILISVEEDWRQKPFSIDFNERELKNGELFSSSYRVKYLDDIVISAVPDRGYAVDYLKVNNKLLTPSRVKSDGTVEYDYTVDSARVSVRVAFIREDNADFYVTLEKATDGTVKVNKATAKTGDQIKITVTPNEGKVIDKVLIDNIEISGKDGVYTFTMPKYNVSVKATFKDAASAPSSPVITPEEKDPAKYGWVKVNNYWKYKKPDGKYAIGWIKDGSSWYYMDRAGDMLTGWQSLDNNWYYLKSSGAMATGWQVIGGSWYYLKSSGDMATGWVLTGGNWYYLYKDGKMASSTTIDGYKLNSDGAWIR